jgi:hypothetical protein
MVRPILSLAVVAALATTAGALTDPASAKKIVENGGEFWTSPAEFTAAETTIAPGKRLLFWPEHDEVYDATRKRPALRLYWQLLPDEKQFKKGQALKLSIHAPTDSTFTASAIVHPMAGAENGIVSVTLPLEKCEGSGVTDLVLYLGLKEPQSNLLNVKVRFERLTKAPTVPVR